MGEAENSPILAQRGVLMRVLEITVSSGFGGGPQHIFELVSRLKNNNVEIDIACPNEEPYWKRFHALASGQLVEIPHRYFSLKTAWRLVNHVRRNKINIVHSHGKGSGVYGRFVAALTGLPLIHTPHGIHLDQYGRAMRAIYQVYEKLTGSISSVVIFVSESERERAQSLGFWRSVPWQVISNGVSSWPTDLVTNWRQSLRQAQGISEDEVVVVSLSRFDYPKNMKEMALIAKQTSDASFWFLGDGTERSEIQAFCDAHAPGRVWFPGFVEDPVRYLAAADIYLSTSRWEGLPLAILEAMSLGKPVVASDVTGNRDAVKNEETGFFYNLGDVKQASSCLLRLIENVDLRHRLGSNGQERQRRLFSVDTMATQTLAVYQTLMTGKCK